MMNDDDLASDTTLGATNFYRHKFTFSLCIIFVLPLPEPLKQAKPLEKKN